MATTRVAVVTGGNRGLGLETCRQLAKAGLDVVLACRDQLKGEEAIAQLLEERLSVAFHQLDVSSHESVRQLAIDIRKDYGRLDVLVNNAGVALDKRSDGSSTMSIMETSVDRVKQTMDTNLYGAMMLCQELIPIMKEHKYGRIVNVSSGLGQLSEMGVGYSGYRMSKVALNALTRMVAEEFKSNNILVNSVCPGWVKTDMGGPNAPRTVEEGVDTIVWLAQLPDNGPTGFFYRDRKKISW